MKRNFVNDVLELAKLPAVHQDLQHYTATLEAKLEEIRGVLAAAYTPGPEEASGVGWFTDKQGNNLIHEFRGEMLRERLNKVVKLK